MSYGTDRTVVNAVIAPGGSLSAEVNINGKRIVGIEMPAAWTGAAMTFQAVTGQPTGNPPAPVFSEVVDIANAAISIATPTQGTYIALADTIAYIAWGRMKVRSGTSGAPVAQAGGATIGLVCVDR